MIDIYEENKVNNERNLENIICLLMKIKSNNEIIIYSIMK